MTAKAKKKLGWGLTAIIVLSTIALTAFFISMKEAPTRKAGQDNTLLISTIAIKNHPLNAQVEVLGKTSGKEKIEIYTEVSGILENTGKSFLEGVFYKKGETLLKINSDENYMSLVSQRSSLLNLITGILPDLKYDYPESYERWKTYLDEFKIEETTKSLPEPAIKKEKYFIAGQNIYQIYYIIKSLETRQAKYTIVAPFDGVVSLSAIKPGTLVRSGQKVGEYFNPSVYDVEVEVKLPEIDFVRTGDKALLQDAAGSHTWEGKVTRISDVVNSHTQTVMAYITVRGENLREGLFLTGKILTHESFKAFEIPRKTIINENQVYVIKDSSVKKSRINIIQTKEETCIASGLSDGVLISANTKGISEGIKVKY